MKKLLLLLVMISLVLPQTGHAAIIDTVRGRILLQVESHGEAWYVNPVNNQRYYMGRAEDAYALMRKLSLGIKHTTLIGYLKSSFPVRLSGRIMLDVENHGEAYYVNPLDLKGYYLKDGAAAFSLMRSKGLGITNTNLSRIPISPDSAPVLATQPAAATTMVKFTSAEDFQNYVNKASNLYTDNYLPLSSFSRTTTGIEPPVMAAPEASMNDKSAAPGGSTTDRVSTTNVQVSGIDEPDIVKVNGSQLFYSGQTYYYPWRMVDPMPIDTLEGTTIMPEYQPPTTKAFTAYPPESLQLASEIEQNGNLLLSDKTLIVFDYANITGYSVVQTAAPTKQWNIELQQSSSVVTSRLYQNNLYVITQTPLYDTISCPIQPLARNTELKTIACGEIYHPIMPVPTDAIYTVWKINPATGDILDKNAVSGTAYSSIIYMSTNNLYVTNAQPGDFVSFVIQFLMQNESLFPVYLNTFFKDLQSYDITAWEKKDKLVRAIQGWLATLPPDEETRIMNELTNRYDSFAKANIRNYEKTVITKMNLDSLDITATGSVPGSLLNQFSLGEENNVLFLASTIGENQFFNTTGTVNDVYSLDANLSTLGSLQDLGLSERIYAVRFMQNKAYLVTFRQIDPFYVIDLSNPRDLKVSGELKIPGYSAYLHPINDTTVIGVGQEDWQVKLSLFDVSNPALPTEKSKYVLSENYSDVLNDHHAFLQDERHQIIFIPGADAGYVFSYANNQLTLLKTYTGISARRAVYINDYLYIVGDTGITVINENNWSIVKELSF